MEWVKLSTRYFRDKAIVLRTDAHEVMFARGLAMAGELEAHGFLPDEVIPDLARNKRTAKRLANDLASVPNPVWERVRGGYQIVNWDQWQKELELLLAKKERERERKRRARAAERAARETSADAGADGSADCPHENEAIESKTQSKTAAAAAVGAAAAVDNLPDTVAIFRSKIHNVTPLRSLRFDMTAAQQADLECLIATHGDQRLIDEAVRTLRTPPPTKVTAFFKTWSELRAPGDPVLRVVPEPECDLHPGKPARTCSGCAADRLAGDA